jgi:hypothetical protein
VKGPMASTIFLIICRRSVMWLCLSGLNVVKAGRVARLT